MHKQAHLYRYLTTIFSLLMAFWIIPGQARDFKGAELRTFAEYTYGRFEVRMKAPDATGVLSSLFTYHEINDMSEWNEVDVEIIGRYENCVQFNTITPHRANHVRAEWVDFNPQNDYHDYAFEWTPDYVAWFIDGLEVYRQTGAHIATLSLPQKMMMNIWNPVYDNWVGEWNPDVLPVFAYYDRAGYASYTPGNGNTGTENNFTLEWVDEFDTWDQSRWAKATHTFEGNNCDFYPDNAVFKDGNMILCLTDNDNTGYTDPNPPTVLWAQGQDNRILVRFSEEISQESAEESSNYKIAELEIYDAKLLAGNRYVELETANLDADATYNMVVLGIKDVSDAANMLYGQVVQVYMDMVRSYPLKINFGGSEYTGYLPAQQRAPENTHGYMDGTDVIWPPSVDITNTADDALFQSERRALVNYTIRMENGTYDLLLKFSENKFDTLDMRVFDIFVEGKKEVSSLDLYKQAGKNAAYELGIENILVQDQELNIHFAAIKGEAVINALEVHQDPSGLRGSINSVVSDYWIAQNYPNPFNPVTHIPITIATKQKVQLVVYDIAGRIVGILVDGYLDPGRHVFSWTPGNDISSGIYFYRLELKNRSNITKKLIYLR